MARDFANSFYASKPWRECRQLYIQNMKPSARGLCEKCFANGLHVLGEELHHKVWLTPENIKDPDISLNHKNLILLCRDCHQKEHGTMNEVLYVFDEEGNPMPKQ